MRACACGGFFKLQQRVHARLRLAALYGPDNGIGAHAAVNSALPVVSPVARILTFLGVLACRSVLAKHRFGVFKAALKPGTCHGRRCSHFQVECALTPYGRALTHATQNVPTCYGKLDRLAMRRARGAR